MDVKELAVSFKDKLGLGMHDISVRRRLPKDLMTLTMPYELFAEINKDIDQSFIITDSWKAIKERNIQNADHGE